MHNQKKAYAFAIAAIFFWGTAASAFKISLRYQSIGVLLLIATLASIACLAVIVLVSGCWREFGQWNRSDYRYSAMLGFLNPFACYVIIFHAYDLLPAQEAQPLNFIWPIVLVVLSVFILGQKLRLYSIVALLICFAGVMVIATRGDVLSFRFSEPLGVSLALASTVLWALYWLYSARDQRHPVNRLLCNFIFGLLPVTLYVWWFDDGIVPPWQGIAGGVYVGLFEMGITYVMWLKALKLSETTARIGVFVYFTPFLSLLMVSILVGETILASTMVGLTLIIAGVLVQHVFDRRAN